MKSDREVGFMLKVNMNVFKGVLFLCLAIIVLAITPSQVGVIEGEIINSRSFPYLVTGIMIASSLLLILEGLMSKQKTYFIVSKEEAKKWVVPLAVFVLVLIYVLIIPILGFVISSFIATTVLLLMVKCKKPLYYIIIFICIFAIYYLFTEFLTVPLPSLDL